MVVQVSGQKRWKLWRPSSPLQSTAVRVPYEESSIYNEMDPVKQATLQWCPPDYDILLQPGDILIIPKHWWHFVVTESNFAISVNAWQEEITDSTERLNEAMTRFCFGAILSALKEVKYFSDQQNGYTSTLNSWINPSEIDKDGCDTVTDHVSNYEYVKTSMQECGHSVENTHENIRRFIEAMLRPDAVKKCFSIATSTTKCKK